MRGPLLWKSTKTPIHEGLNPCSRCQNLATLLLWANNSDVPAALSGALSLKLHLVWSLCQGFSTPGCWCAPCALSFLIVIFFSCQDGNGFFFLVVYSFAVLSEELLVSLNIMAFLMFTQDTLLSIHMSPGCLGLRQIKARPPPCSSQYLHSHPWRPDPGAMSSTPGFFYPRCRFSFASSFQIYLLLARASRTPQIQHALFYVWTPSFSMVQVLFPEYSNPLCKLVL